VDDKNKTPDPAPVLNHPCRDDYNADYDTDTVGDHPFRKAEEVREFLASYQALHAAQLRREREVLSNLEFTINQIAQEHSAERKRVREALLAGLEEISFSITFFGVELPGGKVACHTAKVRNLINRILHEGTERTGS
jgi:hypothetical protein